MLGLNAFCRARQIDIMLGRSLSRKGIGPCASVGKGAEFGVNRDQGFFERCADVVKPLVEADQIEKIAMLA